MTDAPPEAICATVFMLYRVNPPGYRGRPGQMVRSQRRRGGLTFVTRTVSRDPAGLVYVPVGS